MTNVRLRGDQIDLVAVRRGEPGSRARAAHRGERGRDPVRTAPGARQLLRAGQEPGPDALRGVYPVVATITSAGFQRVEDDELAARYEVIAAEATAR